MKGRSPQGGGETSEGKKWRVVSPGGRARSSFLPATAETVHEREQTRVSSYLLISPLFTQTGRCHFQSHALVWADHPPPSKTRMTTITIKVLVLSLPQGLFSPSAWFLECVFCCVLQCHDRFLSPPTPMVFVAPPPPLLWLITMTRHWPKDMYIELQALETEIGCETKQTNKKMGKAHLQSQGHVYALPSPLKPPGGRRSPVSLCRVCVCVCEYMVHLSSSPTFNWNSTRSGCSVNYTQTVCLRVSEVRLPRI